MQLQLRHFNAIATLLSSVSVQIDFFYHASILIVVHFKYWFSFKITHFRLTSFTLYLTLTRATTNEPINERGKKRFISIFSLAIVYWCLFVIQFSIYRSFTCPNANVLTESDLVYADSIHWIIPYQRFPLIFAHRLR